MQNGSPVQLFTQCSFVVTGFVCLVLALTSVYATVGNVLGTFHLNRQHFTSMCYSVVGFNTILHTNMSPMIVMSERIL